MSPDVRADVAFVVGVWCEALLYGIHLVVFGVVCSILLSKPYKRGRETSTAILLAFTTCMFIISTAHIALALQELLLGFIYQRALDPRDFFQDNLFPPRKALYIIITILGDSLLIWRVHVIWGRKWISALPLFFLLGSTTCGVKAIISSTTAPGPAVFSPRILSWVFATFALNIATQLVCTTLIAAKIHRAASSACARNRPRYVSFVWVVVESGAIYTAAAVVQLALCLTKHNAGVALEMMLAQLSAIAPALIVVRIGMGVAYGGNKNEASREEAVFTTVHDTLPTSIGSVSQPVCEEHQGCAGEQQGEEK